MTLYIIYFYHFFIYFRTKICMPRILCLLSSHKKSYKTFFFNFVVQIDRYNLDFKKTNILKSLFSSCIFVIHLYRKMTNSSAFSKDGKKPLYIQRKCKSKLHACYLPQKILKHNKKYILILFHSSVIGKYIYLKYPYKWYVHLLKKISEATIRSTWKKKRRKIKNTQELG